MQIRTATPGDFPVMLELLEMLFSLEHDFEFDAEKANKGFELMLDDPEVRTVLVVESEGEVVGMCSGQLLMSTAMGTPSLWVEDVILRPQFRGRGWMPQMLNELEKWAISKGATRVQVLCDLHNEPALKFYPKAGFERTQLGLFKKFI
jgi:GNAT superfamily N-acetyltransferase